MTLLYQNQLEQIQSNEQKTLLIENVAVCLRGSLFTSTGDLQPLLPALESIRSIGRPHWFAV
jgi:hypothetical protein